ncbi:hypothetical protein EB796_009622 [Bugula neritina]|uniref:Uncharacterized protein n=1 Tax=Bugula neritina TaxID=10212 RepID=A0A7J7K3A9_BUGNE|nr:hypothetical protein EB796_009622 [Bugula neritina]
MLETQELHCFWSHNLYSNTEKILNRSVTFLSTVVSALAAHNDIYTASSTLDTYGRYLWKTGYKAKQC